MASLIVVTGASKGDYYPLGRRSNVIGRNEALPIQILDGEVSRKHLKIRYDQDTDTYSVVDLNSRHGVLINGAKIADELELADNTYITIGQTTLFFTLKDFEGRENALNHFKKVGERTKGTLPDHPGRFFPCLAVGIYPRFCVLSENLWRTVGTKTLMSADPPVVVDSDLFTFVGIPLVPLAIGNFFIAELVLLMGTIAERFVG